MDDGKTVSTNNGHAAGLRPQNGGVIKVQPPGREDLQPSYAQTLQGDSDDANTNGWYGSMSTSCQTRCNQTTKHVLTNLRQNASNCSSVTECCIRISTSAYRRTPRSASNQPYLHPWIQRLERGQEIVPWQRRSHRADGESLGGARQCAGVLQR